MYYFLMEDSENCISSPVREEEYSAESFSDIPASVLSKLNLTAEKSCCNGSETASCQSSQSGMTLRRSMGDHGEEKLMWYAEDSHAKTLVKLEPQTEISDLPDLKAACGSTWQGSLAKWDRNAFLWRTRQCLLLEDSTECLETFPIWGLMHDGELWQQQTLVPLISEKGFGYLPTPDASLGMKFGRIEMTWAMDSVTCSRKEDSGMRPSGSKIGSSLRWHPEFILEALRTGGELNPQWTEALMGWPIDWTDLKPLEMDKFLTAWLLPGQRFVDGLNHDK